MMIRRQVGVGVVGAGGIVGGPPPTRSGVAEVSTPRLTGGLRHGARRFGPQKSEEKSSRDCSPGEEGDKNGKLDQLYNIRYKLEHNQISRSEVDKSDIFEILNLHLIDPDTEIQHTALQLIQDILPHLGPETDTCMSIVTAGLMPCLGSQRVTLRKTTVHILQIYLRFSSDVQAVLRCIVNHGLESGDKRVVHETLISIPILFPPDFDSRYGNKNLYILVSGLARKLLEEDTKLPAYLSMQKIADVVGNKTFLSYISKLTSDQKKVYDELAESRARLETVQDQPDGIVGKRISGGWVEYGAIDHTIIEKLQNEEEPKVRLQGAEDLHRCIKNMIEMTPLLQQIRLFFNFLESMLEEQNFKMNLLILEIYGMIIDRLKSKMKPNIRSVVSALLKHASDSKVVVRIENYKVLEKLMLAVKPNTVINHLLDHLGDKKALVREAILNMIMFGLLTFPSNEFDLKNIAATVVPTLVDPKRRVRHAALESVSILAAFLGPTKAVPLIRAIELLESHFEKGAGVLTAVQARLARRQLARVTGEGLIDYALQIPTSATRSDRKPSPQRGGGSNWGSDVDWVLAGSGSIGSGSARSGPRPESRLDSSIGSASLTTSPTSPVQVNGTQVHLPWSKSKNGSLNSSNKSSSSRRSRSEENVNGANGATSPRENTSYDWRANQLRSNTESDLKYKGFQILPSKMPATNMQNGNSAWTSRNATAKQNRANESLPNLEGNFIPPSKKEGVPYSSNSNRRDSSYNGRKNTPESELPRLIGTKSQASTASSSATRDSGISMTERNNDIDSLSDRLRTRAGSRPKWKHSPNGAPISVDTLPVTGQAVNLTRRGSNDSTDSSEHKPNSNKPSSRLSIRKNNFRKSASGKKGGQTANGDNLQDDEVVISAITDLNGEGSPRTPRYFPDETPMQPKASLLLRPVDNSPFSSHSRRGRSGSSDNVSTPYSQISGISSYEYEDDFTSDESEFSAMTNMSRKSTSKIPIKRSSSLHRRTGFIKSGTQGERTPQAVPRSPSYVPEPEPEPKQNEKDVEVLDAEDTLSPVEPSRSIKSVGSRNKVSTSKFSKIPTSPTKSKDLKKVPSKLYTRTKSVSPNVQSRQKLESNERLSTAKSTSDIPAKNDASETISEQIEEPEPRNFPATEPPKRRTYDKSVSNPSTGRRSYSSISGGSRRSTAASVSSTSSIQTLPLVTVPSLKSPYDGVKIIPWAKPDEAIEKVMEQLDDDDWEKNMDGLNGMIRLVHHHPETIIVEYKQATQLILKQIKNLRSQVGRSAVHVVGDMFEHLKRSMESDIEKIALPLIMKTGETNRFLREDCNQALDRMVENVSPSRAIAVITAEPLNNKNPVIRTTVSRLLAYITEKIGPNKALGGSKDITERLLPAVAKLAQDGSLEARIYAKMTLKVLMEHEDFERILKKNVTANTMRNLEKVLDSVRNNGLASASSSKRGLITKPKRNNRKTL